MLHKICNKCGVDKPLTDFCKASNNKMGHYSYCKECCRKRDSPEHIRKEEKRKWLYEQGLKECTMCHEIKPLSEFHKRKTAKKDGLRNDCIICQQNYARNFARTEEQKQKKKDRENNPEFLNKLNDYRRTSKKYREYRKRYQNKHNKEKFKNNQNYRITSYLRNRIWASLKIQGVKKEIRFNELIGCSVEFLRDYLELQFKENMTWENYGKGIGKWSIDHIIPCAYFDLTKVEEQRKCFHYSNLQPLWVSENSSKGSYYNGVVYKKNIKK